MNRSSAEILALEALAWAAESGALADFLDRSGMEIDDLKQRAKDPQVLAAVLDFLLTRDELTKAFCDWREIQANHVRVARHLLSGGRT